MKLSKHAKFWALGALGGVGLFALGVFAQQTLEINPSEQDLFSDLKAVFFLDRNGDEIKSIVRWNASGSTLVTAPTSELTGGEAKNTLQNNASIIGSTDSSNTSAGAFLIATNGGKVEWESMQSFIWGANNTTLSGFNTIAVATKDTNINADNALALASKNTNITAKDAIAIGWEDIKLKGQASLAIWSKIDSAAQGAMVFNAKNEQLNLNNESNNTFVINAENGLIVNTNTSANPKIQLTVNGAIKLWEVNNAPAQASPYISTKKVGNVICICGKVNNGNIAISKYSRNNKQHAEICQKVCNNESPTLPGQCGAAATNYPLGQTQWSTDDFCQWGIGYAWAKPTFPALGGQTTWTCESFPSGGVNCTATRKGCGDGIRAAGEQCDLGTNNGKPDSNCSASCENIKAPKCWANAKTYLGSDVAWAQPNGFCTDDSVLGETTPAFWNGSTSWQKTWTCKNKNNKNLTCSANRLPPAVAGVCGTTLNTCSAGTLSGQTTIPHGKRWSCDGLYGGSNKTCSTCDSGYKYNTTTNICEIDCPNPIYRHTNGVTIKAADCAEAGKEYMFEGQKYYVARDKDDIKEKIAANTYPANRIVTTRVSHMSQMFYQNSSFNQDIGNWDTSKVIDMHGMFQWAQAFNQPLNNWDTSNVTDMRYMFRSAHAFNQPLNNWDTSKVTDMRGMFYEAQAFNQPLNNWDTSKVTNMSIMFANAQAFDQPLNNWDTSKVTTMQYMFRWAKAFNQPLNNWDTSNVTYMRGMFYEAQAFNQPLNNWDTSKVTNMSIMFANAQAFDQPLNNWDTSKVTTMQYMFRWAEAFNQPLNNWDTSKVTDMSWMFASAKAFDQPLNNWDTSKVAGMSWMFYETQAFNQPLNNRRINQIWDENLKGMFTNATAFKANQPYCSWVNWSAKKWNFVNMGLNACINGQCKAYPWNHASQPATATANGCVGGDYQDIADDANNWKWKCNGKYGATSTECSASKQPAPVNGQCKAYPWNHASQPATATANACVAGDYQDIADDTNNWKWKCIGKYSGTSTECSASKQLTCPSGFTASNGKCVKWECKKIASSYTPGQCDGGTYTETALSAPSCTLRSIGLLWNGNPKAIPELCKKLSNAECSNPKSSGVEAQAYYCGIPNRLLSSFTSGLNTPWGYNGVVLEECKGKNAEYSICQISQGSTTSTHPCSSLSHESECRAKNCTRTPWAWAPASAKVNCIDNLWNTLPDSQCASLWSKPTCSPDVEQNITITKVDCSWIHFHLNGNPNLWTTDLTFSTDGKTWWAPQNAWQWNSPREMRSTYPKKWWLRLLYIKSGSWIWTGIAEYDISSCYEQSKINGQCKTYAWNHTSQPATATANGCVAGDYQDIADDSNNWKWKCNGKNGGTSTECSASKQPAPVNGQCKIYPWNHASQPATNSMNGCLAGDYEDIADHSNYWVWKCNGKNGWEAEECAAKQNSIILTSTEPIVACDEWLISSPLTVQWERNELDIDTDGEPMSLRLKFKINFWANWKATDDHWHPNICRILIKDILSEDNAQKYRRALNKLLDEPSEKIAKTSESGYKLSLYHAVIRWTDLELQLSLRNLYQKMLFRDDHISVTINAYK